MKFIGTIHNEIFDNKKLFIRLEHFHRTVTGSLSKTQLYFFPRKYIFNGAVTKEIIISQYPPNKWSDIFRLKFRVLDRPGITADISKILYENDISIYTQESEMTRSLSFFNISLIADFNIFCKKEKRKFSSLEDRRKYLEDKFEKIFSEKLKQEIDKFSLKRINFLNFNSDIYKQKEQNILGDNVLKKYYASPDTYSAIVKDKKIKIHNELLNDLNVSEEVNGDFISFTINSDTEEKYLLLRFFNHNQKIIQFDIKHQNSLGAIKVFSNKIRKLDENINIINSYNRLDNITSAHWIVMLDITKTSDNNIWYKLLNEFKEINTVTDVKVLECTNILESSSTIEIQKQRKVVDNLKKYDKLKIDYEQIKFLLKIALGINILFISFTLIILYYAFDDKLDANNIIKPISFLALLGGFIAIIIYIYKGLTYLLKTIKNKT